MNELERRIRKLEVAVSRFARELRFAFQYTQHDAGSSLLKSRIVLEKVVFEIYLVEMEREPRKPLLGDMLLDNQFTRKIERRIVSRMNSIRDMANLGSHGEIVESSDARKVLDDLCEVLEWFLRWQKTKLPPGSPADDADLAFALDDDLPDLSGDWIITETYEHGTTTGQFTLEQSGSRLSGVLSVVDRDKKNNVVHLELVVAGVTNGTTVTLRATSVRCIEGKLPHGYELDTWAGTIRDHDTITGESKDEGGVSGQFVIRRKAKLVRPGQS